MTAQVLNVIPALILILLLIVGLAFLARRYAPALTRPSALLSVQASMSLGGKERVVLVKAGDEFLLLGVSPGRVQTLHVMDPEQLREAAQEDGSAQPGAGFAAILQNLNRKY